MSKLDDILFFQSQPMSGNMLSDWQIEQAKQQIKDLFNELIDNEPGLLVDGKPYLPVDKLKQLVEDL